MEPFRRLRSRTVVLPATDIDTDQIIPARFLTTTRRDGFGDALFADWRFDAKGSPRPGFVDDPRRWLPLGARDWLARAAARWQKTWRKRGLPDADAVAAWLRSIPAAALRQRPRLTVNHANPVDYRLLPEGIALIDVATHAIELLKQSNAVAEPSAVH